MVSDECAVTVGQKRRLASVCSSPQDVKMRKVIGSDQGGHMYECHQYVWTEKRAKCATRLDRKFASKRMALLYIAKMNSASLQTYLAESGKQWGDLCKDTGIHAVRPNRPFDLEAFLDLPDEDLELYAQAVGGALTVHKAPQGSIYRYSAVPLATTDVQELVSILES